MLKFEDMHKFFTNNTFFIFFKLDFFSLKKMEEKDIKEDQKDLLNIIFNQSKLHKLKEKILKYSGSNVPSSHMSDESYDTYHGAHFSCERREHYSQTTLEIFSLCSSFINITLLLVGIFYYGVPFKTSFINITLLLARIFLSPMNKIK